MQRAQRPATRQHRATAEVGMMVLKRSTLSLWKSSSTSISISEIIGGTLLLTKLQVPSIRGVGVGVNSGAIASTNPSVYSSKE